MRTLIILATLTVSLLVTSCDKPDYLTDNWPFVVDDVFPDKTLAIRYDVEGARTRRIVAMPDNRKNFADFTKGRQYVQVKGQPDRCYLLAEPADVPAPPK